jgi:hypothetical protein
MSVVPINKHSLPPVGANMDAIHANRVHVWVDASTARIIFGDSIDDDYLRWFGAVALPRQTAKDLVKALSDLLKRTE